MKKILVPTDFSRLSDNALQYAVQLAAATQAELFLLHVYTVPVFAEDAVLITTEQYLLEEALDSLGKLKDSIEKSQPEVKVSIDAMPGVPVGTIQFYAEKRHADPIIIGAQGVGYLQERVLGSTASTLIRKTKIPVMVIDKHVRFRTPKKIVLAADFEETNDQEVLKPLKQLAAKFKSHICILNIFTEAQVVPSFGEISESFNLDKALKHTYHTFFEAEHPDVVMGINDFVKKNDIDMVVVISRKHSLIGRLFREPVTTSMTFHTRVPLLTLHE